ncbi:MAG: hypothetical protein ACRBFS_20885 [Aureispira sp.]
MTILSTREKEIKLHYWRKAQALLEPTSFEYEEKAKEIKALAEEIEKERAIINGTSES